MLKGYEGMALLPADDPNLRKQCVEIVPQDVPASLFEEMQRTCTVKGGLGLAGPQVGFLWRIFVMRYGNEWLTVCNPVLLKTRGFSVEREGCLSLPGVWVRVGRPDIITAQWQDETGERVRRKLSGMDARVFQHELAHLNGKLINA